jgi:chaperonin GroEL
MQINKSIKITETFHGEQTIQSLLKGINALYNPVASTLGAAGRTVIIEDDFGNPKPTKDGVTVAKAIIPLNSSERMGSEILKQAALNTANEAGDGTTTSTVIAKAIIDKGLEFIRNKKSNYTDFNKGMELAVSDIIQFIDKFSKPVTLSNIENVASISANNDSDLGKIISEAFKKAGEYGVVLMDKSKTNETYVSITQGFEIEKGYKSDIFVNIKETSRVEYDNAAVLLSTVKIERVSQIETQLEYVITNNLPLVIVSEMEEDMLAMLAYNVVKTKKLKAVVINPTHFGQRRRDIMNDLAVYTGASLIDEATGDNFETVSFDCLGKINRIISDKTKTIFFNNLNENVENHIKIIKSQLENENNSVEKEFLEERIAKISSSVAVVNVGANSVTEQNEKSDRVEDAICAVKAALADGVVSGGGIALYDIYNMIYNKKIKIDDKYLSGYTSVLESIKEPLQIILANGDVDYDLDFFNSKKKPGKGINVKNGKIGDMFKMNIIDPAKVVKTAVKNAVSAASTILSTSSTIVNLQKIN